MLIVNTKKLGDLATLRVIFSREGAKARRKLRN
ncbi:hypothetical protein AEQU2_02877 [Aequorivita lipolytica]|nr:hypothetical protein AEQU2_02877 [Aequorivita lipolytica]